MIAQLCDTKDRVSRELRGGSNMCPRKENPEMSNNNSRYHL